MKQGIERWKRRLSTSAAHWLLGYVAVLLCGVGVVYYWRVIYAFGALNAWVATTVVCVTFSVVYWLVFLCAHFLRQSLPLKTAALIVLAGLCFGAANPPLQAPDESMHFLRAYSIGSGNFLFEQYEDYPDDVDLLDACFNNAVYAQEDGAAGAFGRYVSGLENGHTSANPQTLVQQIVAYVPQALGVAAGRLFGANALVCLYLARFVNLLFYAAAGGLAVYLAGRFQAILIALMLCPISLYMAASCSADGVFLGLMWLFIGACLSPVITKKRLAALAVSFGIIFYIKFTALALLPLVFLLPWNSVQLRLGRRQVRPWMGGVLGLGLCAVVAAVLYVLQNGYVTWASNYVGLEYFDPNIVPSEQFKFILSNPARYLMVFVYTLYRENGYLFSLGTFGSLDVVVQVVNLLAPLLLLLAAGFSALEGAREPKRTAVMMLLTAALLYGFSFTGMYLTCTPVTLPEINGVQARYLLAAFFALTVSASMLIGRTMALQELRPGRPQKTPPAWRMLHLCFVFAVFSAVMLFQSYYICD